MLNSMAQTLLSPIPSALAFQHVQQRPLKVQGGGSALGRVRNGKCKSPWQTMLDTSGGSNPMELSTSGRELPLFHLYRLSFETEQDKRMQQQREFYLNYGRALRVLREDIPRYALAGAGVQLQRKVSCSTQILRAGAGHLYSLL